MKNVVEHALFLAFGFFVRVAGLNLARRLSWFFTLIFFYIIPIRKDVTINNLRNAFPEYSEKKIKKIAFESYTSFVIAFFEILYLPRMSGEQIMKAVKCDNPEFIEKKYEEKKGVILLSAHFGNWEYIALSVSKSLNIPFNVIVKQQRNPYVSDWLNKARTKWINNVILLGASIRQVYKVLTEKNIVAMVADQRGPEEGIKINFFGRMTSVYSGPALLALKTGAPLLYGIAVRQKDYSYHTVIEEISKENLPEDEEEKVKVLSQRHTDYLEKYIRQYPEQWFWMHNRWRH